VTRSELKATKPTRRRAALSASRAVKHAKTNGNRKGRRRLTPQRDASQPVSHPTWLTSYEPEDSLVEQDRRDQKVLYMANLARDRSESGELALLWVLAMKKIRLISRWVIKNPHGQWTCYQDVDDLYVEILDRMHRYLPLRTDEFESADHFWKWVYKLGFTQYIDGLRKSVRLCRGLESLEGADTLSVKETVSEQASALDLLMNAEMYAMVLECLSHEDRAILVAWRCDGLPLQRLGEMFGIGTHREEVRRRIQGILNKVSKYHRALTEKARVTRSEHGYD